MTENRDIICPNCQTRIDVQQVLAEEVEKSIRQKYEQQAAHQRQELLKQQEGLLKQVEEFEEKKKRENEIFKERMQKREEELKVQLSAEAQKAQAEKEESMKKEILEKQQEIKRYKEMEVELMRKERKIHEERENMQIEKEKAILEAQKEIEEKVRLKEREHNELKNRELQKQIDDQKKLIEEMKRKAEQGSMQLQGEVMELALEDLLRASFPFDHIDEVKKGHSGADVIQTVVNPMQRACGKIVFESKRTKAFSDSWIDKLKEDMIEEGGSIAVLVSEVLPDYIDRYGQYEGVWICSFSEVKNLVFVLRQILLQESAALAKNENKGDKMELLYNYLTGEEFKQRVMGVVEGFSAMQSDLDREKRAFKKIWKEREKQIEKTMNHMVEFYGAVSGIGGSVIPRIEMLELPHADEEDED